MHTEPLGLGRRIGMWTAIGICSVIGVVAAVVVTPIGAGLISFLLGMKWYHAIWMWIVGMILTWLVLLPLARLFYALMLMAAEPAWTWDMAIRRAWKQFTVGADTAEPAPDASHAIATPSSEAPTLEAVFGAYVARWQDMLEQYDIWKPESALTAPRASIQRAIKYVYSLLPLPIKWSDYCAFHMAYVDLALYLPDEDYARVKRFNEGRLKTANGERRSGRLIFIRPSVSLSVMQTAEQHEEEIQMLRDAMRRSVMWDPIDASDEEIEAVKRIVVVCAVAFAAECAEWKAHTVSVGRDTYVEDPPPKQGSAETE